MPSALFFYIFLHHLLVDVTGMNCFADVDGLRVVCELYLETLLTLVTSTSSLWASTRQWNHGQPG